MRMPRSLGLFFIIFLLIGVVNAGVVNFNIKPENPVRGDVVTIYGTAGPNEEVRIDISFEKTVPVRNGEYVFSINGVEIPEGKNRFTVTAYGCDDLKVSVKIFFNLIWVTLSSEASNGVATVSKSNVPSGTYDVVIHGKSSRSSVKLKITATGYIKADESGKFSYSYDTSSIPPGKFVVSAGGTTKVITLAESGIAESGSSLGSPSSSGGSLGSSAISTPTPTSTPSETPTLTPALTPTPTYTETPITTPAVTALNQSLTPEQTPVPTRAQVQPTAAGNLTQVNNSKNRSLSVRIPGFELMVAIMSLASVLVYKRLKQ